MTQVVDRAAARNSFSVCSHCGAEFKLLRHSARFCGSTCRKAANRKLCHANVTADGPSEAARTSQNDSREHAARPGQTNASAAAKPLSVTRGFAIVPDATWPGMSRIRRPDCTLTEMVNLTRAKDALRALDEDAP